jgi:hypothetical protein
MKMGSDWPLMAIYHQMIVERKSMLRVCCELRHVDFPLETGLHVG